MPAHGKHELTQVQSHAPLRRGFGTWCFSLFMYLRNTYESHPHPEVLHYSASSNATEMCDGIMFDFCPGLPHM